MPYVDEWLRHDHDDDDDGGDDDDDDGEETPGSETLHKQWSLGEKDLRSCQASSRDGPVSRVQAWRPMRRT